VTALDISHQQASAPSNSGGNSFGAFNFYPSKGIDEKKLLIGVGVAFAVYWVVFRRRK